MSIRLIGNTSFNPESTFQPAMLAYRSVAQNLGSGQLFFLIHRTPKTNSKRPAKMIVGRWIIVLLTFNMVSFQGRCYFLGDVKDITHFPLPWFWEEEWNFYELTSWVKKKSIIQLVVTWSRKVLDHDFVPWTQFPTNDGHLFQSRVQLIYVWLVYRYSDSDVIFF